MYVYAIDIESYLWHRQTFGHVCLVTAYLNQLYFFQTSHKLQIIQWSFLVGTLLNVIDLTLNSTLDSGVAVSWWPNFDERSGQFSRDSKVWSQNHWRGQTGQDRNTNTATIHKNVKKKFDQSALYHFIKFNLHNGMLGLNPEKKIINCVVNISFITLEAHQEGWLTLSISNN